jgi:ribosome biogenesis protein UTP30
MEYALKHQEKRDESELLPGKEENIWLQIAVKEIHGGAKLKPHKMCVKMPRFSSKLTFCIVG